MAEQVFMIALSPTMEEGVIGSWIKKEGDTVATGDILCEVETDKASMEYESAQEGVLLKIVVPEGKSAQVGKTIAIIGEKGESYDALLKTIAAEQKADAPPPREQKTEAVAPPAADSDSSPAPPTAPAAASPTVTHPQDARIAASPLARKIAESHSIPLTTIAGSGPQGRIIKRDVEQALAAGAQRAPQTISPSTPRADEEIAVSPVRKVIAKRLSESKFSAPHYYVSISINMDEVIKARALLNKEVQTRGAKVSFNAFLIKFAAESVRRNPDINVSWQGDTIKKFGSVDIGLAVDVGHGLITPIVRDCLAKGVLTIDDELSALIEKARNNALRVHEFQGATFSISNLGSFGVDSFTAIINPPGSAIMAIGKTTPTPIVDEGGAIVVRPMMQINLTCDHRVIDGKIAAHFLRDFKALLEHPARLIF